MRNLLFAYLVGGLLFIYPTYLLEIVGVSGLIERNTGTASVLVHSSLIVSPLAIWLLLICGVVWILTEPKK